MGFRRYALGAVVAMLAAGALLGSISSGSAASPAVTFGLECPPGFSTPGDEWGCHGTITNDGPQTATHMTLVRGRRCDDAGRHELCGRRVHRPRGRSDVVRARELRR